MAVATKEVLNEDDGVFFAKVYKNPKGEFTLKLAGYELQDHVKYGKHLKLQFEIMDAGEFEGQGVSLTIWPNQKTMKLEPTYGSKPNNFARVQIALMGAPLRAGESINFKKLVESGTKIKAYIKEDVKEDGTRWPKIDVESLEPVR
jgi:hypothetical protein